MASYGGGVEPRITGDAASKVLFKIAKPSTPPTQSALVTAGPIMPYGSYPAPHGQFEKSPDKNLSSYGDELEYRAIAERNCKLVFAAHTKTSQQTLAAKLEEIRQQARERQNAVRSPAVVQHTPQQAWVGVSGTSRYRAAAAGMSRPRVRRPVFSAVPAGWRPRYPEPDLRGVGGGLQQFHKTTRLIERHVAAAESTAPPPASAPSNQQRPQPPGEPPRSSGRMRRPKTAPPRFTEAVEEDEVLPGETEKFTALQVVDLEETTAGKVGAEGGVVEGAAASAGGKNNEMTIKKTQIIQEAEALEDAYDKAVKKYGWKMELPGDPLGLKKGLTRERLAYTVNIPIPEVLPTQPMMKRENKDTFFHTTMPKAILSFDIAPDFTSENYNRMRSQLIEKGQWNYAYKDFAFAY